jgi:hypothetical protein
MEQSGKRWSEIPSIDTKRLASSSRRCAPPALKDWAAEATPNGGELHLLLRPTPIDPAKRT